MLGETMQIFGKKFQVVEEAQPKEKRPMALDKNSKFIYQRGADVQRVWRRFGWTPPTEYRMDYEFSKNRELDQQAKGEKWMKV